jgi:hypothetical protein
MAIISTNDTESAMTFNHVFSPFPIRLRKAVFNRNKPPNPLKPPTLKGELGLVFSILFVIIILKFKTIHALIIPL